jgi:hypothetical protein
MGSNNNTTSHTAPKRSSGRGKAVQTENQLNPAKKMSDALKTVNARIKHHIDPYSDAMDSKFEIIDNDKTQEIVFLRQSHDLVDCVSLYFSDLKTHSPLLGKILETQAANAALQKEPDENIHNEMGLSGTPTIMSNIWQSWYVVFQTKIIT